MKCCCSKYGKRKRKQKIERIDLLPCDISPDFPYRGAYRGNNVPGA